MIAKGTPNLFRCLLLSSKSASARAAMARASPTQLRRRPADPVDRALGSSPRARLGQSGLASVAFLADGRSHT